MKHFCFKLDFCFLFLLNNILIYFALFALVLLLLKLSVMAFTVGPCARFARPKLAIQGCLCRPLSNRQKREML